MRSLALDKLTSNPNPGLISNEAYVYSFEASSYRYSVASHIAIDLYARAI